MPGDIRAQLSKLRKLCLGQVAGDTGDDGRGAVLSFSRYLLRDLVVCCCRGCQQRRYAENRSGGADDDDDLGFCCVLGFSFVIGLH